MGTTTKSSKVLATTTIAFNYHDALETTTQDERGMNRLRVNAQIVFYV